MVLYMFKSDIQESLTIEQELSEPIVLELLRDKLIDGECNLNGTFEKYRSCLLQIEKFDNVWLVTVIYEGFFDDSVRGSRF